MNLIYVLLEKETWSNGQIEWDVIGKRNSSVAAENWVNEKPEERMFKSLEVPSPVMEEERLTIQTVCQQELWAGFFGINENGDQPACNQIITVQMGKDCIDFNPDGSIKSVPAFKCPKCKSLLEWPQEWYVVNDPAIPVMNLEPSSHFMGLD